MTTRQHKYDPLRDYLAKLGADDVTMTFEQIADLVGGLPDSAYKHPAWWGNQRNHKNRPHCAAWLDEGFEAVGLDQAKRIVTFRAMR